MTTDALGPKTAKVCTTTYPKTFCPPLSLPDDQRRAAASMREAGTEVEATRNGRRIAAPRLYRARTFAERGIGRGYVERAGVDASDGDDAHLTVLRRRPQNNSEQRPVTAVPAVSVGRTSSLKTSAPSGVTVGIADRDDERGQRAGRPAAQSDG